MADFADGSGTLDRGLRLLDVLAAHPAGRTVTELAADLMTNRPVVYRLLIILNEHGMARRAADGRYRLGLGMLGLAQQAYPMLRVAVAPALQELADTVGATAHLTVADGTEGFAVAVAEPSWTDMHVAYRLGSRHSLDRGAAGRAILVGRAGAASVVHTEGELQTGAVGAAIALSVPRLEASVGVVALGSIDPAAAANGLRRAAARLNAALG